MSLPRLAVSPVGYIPKQEGTLPPGEVDSIVWLVFTECKQGWKANSIWLTKEAALNAIKRSKRKSKVISIYVPGLLLAAATKLRTAE